MMRWSVSTARRHDHCLPRHPITQVGYTCPSADRLRTRVCIVAARACTAPCMIADLRARRAKQQLQ
eukprot:7104803-Alexandrium_andersonii.AAC.1